MPTLRGRVVAGTGNFSYWLEKLSDHYQRKTGMKLFPGTLNLRLDEEWRRPATGFVRLEKEEYGGVVSVSIIPCSVFGRKAFILRTDGAEFNETDHDRITLEIATDVKLRDAFGLKDGDVVEVQVEA
jgi:riboflavin kinase, archaea type